MILVFDLDDTLYPEISYVESGFQAVADFLAPKFGVEPSELQLQMLKELDESGRGQVFNELLLSYKAYTKAMVKICLQVYRNHIPAVHLYNYSIPILNYYSNKYPLYLVTDGNKLVQKKKVDALHVSEYFKHVYITHRFGVKNAKPSLYCFEHILKREKSFPDKMYYVADNPQKDFVNLKKNGIRTVRVLTGSYKNDNYGTEFDAEFTIPDLSYLKEIVN